MVFPQQGHHIFWVGAFRKTGKATQVTKKCGDLAPMAFQLLLRSGCYDHIGDLTR
jgi:hypothetical protein